MPPPLTQLEVFFGDLTLTRAHVYARLPHLAQPGPWSLSGTVRGPRCLHAQTLPTRTRLVDLGPGPSLLARALIPEPVFWTADLPALYDVTIKLQRGDETIATAQREIGLRALGVRGRMLWFDGKPYVPRGVSTRSTTARLAREWHNEVAVYVSDDFAPELLGEASQWGALAFIELPVGIDATVRLGELARYPAVAIAALHRDLPADFDKQTICPNLLLAQIQQSEQLLPIASWADLVIVDVADVARLAELAQQIEKPMLLRRTLRSPLGLNAARAACDALQRDTAAAGQFAGYLV